VWTAKVGGDASLIGMRGQLAGWFLGTTGGMGIDVLNNDILGNEIGYRGAAAALAIGAVIFGTNWLLRLPYRAQLARHTPPVLLGLALAVVVVTLVDSRVRTGTAILAAVGLIAATVFILTDLATAARFVFGAGFIGFGVVAISAGVAMMREGDLLVGTAVAGGAVAVVGFGMAALRESNLLFGAADIGIGAALIALGVAALHENDILLGLAFLGFGLAFIGAGVARLCESDLLFGAALIGIGPAVMGVGVAVLIGNGPLFGAAVIALGAAGTVVGMAMLYRNDLLVGVGLILTGVAVTGIGVARLHQNDVLFGAAAILTSAAIIGFGAAFSATRAQVRAQTDPRGRRTISS
jgi:hypothetical protein